VKWNIEVIEEQRAAITPTVEWPARCEWDLHLVVWILRDRGLRN